jgi:vitamin B12 transporter
MHIMEIIARGIVFFCLAAVACLLPGSVTASDFPPAQPADTDTLIHLEPVYVKAQRWQITHTGFNRHATDSLDLLKHSFHGLDRLLAGDAGLYIKSYGPGMLTTLSMRGGSASHTALLWNGLPLESPMNGQSDLSLLPVFFFDHISVQYGGSSASWGSGALGGAIFLGNEGIIPKGISLGVGMQAGSLGSFSQHARVSYSGERIRSSVRFFNRRSENRYRFINTSLDSRPRQTQDFAGFEGKGVMGETMLRAGDRHELGINIWIQDDRREIPPTLYQRHTGAQQKDHAVRINTSWQYALDRGVLTWRGAWFDEGLTYKDSLNLESRSQWETHIQEGEAGWQVWENMSVTAGVRLQQVSARADNFSGRESRNLLAAFSSVSWRTRNENLQLRLDGRQEAGEGIKIPFVPAVGLAWATGKGWHLKANAGKNFRLPSLNDLYWLPGGNPELKPEEGWSQDVTISWENQGAGGFGKSLHMNSDERMLTPERLPENLRGFSFTAYHRLVRNWIIWLPAGGGMLWSPTNIMLVRSYGLEARISGHIDLGRTRLDWRGGWNHTISRNLRAKSPNDASVGKQLMYVPKNTGLLNLRLSRGAYELVYDHSFTGRIFVSSDNLQWLSAQTHADLGLSRTFPYRAHRIHLFLQAVNIWNQQYQVMPGRPMPLRYIQGGLHLSLYPTI